MTTKRPSASLPAAGLLLLAVLATVPAEARTLRVGPGGELATVAAAAAKVQDGDTVEIATLALLGLGVLVIIELPLSVVGELLGLAASPDFVCPRVAVPYPPATFVLGILEHGRGDSGPGKRAGG